MSGPAGIPSGALDREWHEIAGAEHFWMAWRFAAFMRQIGSLGVRTETAELGLDVGCGSGTLGAQLESRTAWTIDGADIDPRALGRGTGGRGRRLLYDVSGLRPDLKDRYGLLFLFDVLEHLEDPRAFLRAALFHLRPGGWLFINVPAFERFRSPFDLAVGHLRRYDAPSLAALIDGCPLRLADMRYWGLSLVPALLWRRWKVGDGLPAAEAIRLGMLPPAGTNGLLRGLGRVETTLLPRPPLGTSLLAAAVKTH